MTTSSHFDAVVTTKAVRPFTEASSTPIDFVDLNYCQNCGRVYDTQKELHEVWNGGIRFFLCDECYERYLKSLPSTPPRYDRYSFNEFPSTPLWPHSPVDKSPIPYC